MSMALALKGGTMEKYMCYAVLVIGPLMFLLCLLDIIVGIPFGGGPFLLPDIFCLLASGIITYLGYSAFRDLK